MERQALAVSTTIDLVDLPVNPLSHLLLTLEALNDTGTLTDYQVLAGFLNFIDRVEVIFKGNSIISGDLNDIAVLSGLLTGYVPGQVHQIRTNNDRRAVSFLLPFGRRLFSPMECFPATSRGEFQFRLSSGAASAGMDNVTYSLESVELLNVNPERFTKMTTFTGTATATGEADRDLPRGNPILGVLLFGTTIGATLESANTIRDLKLLVDNKEMFYQLANWDVLHGEISRRLPGPFTLQPHFHGVDIADAGGTYRASLQPELLNGILENYAYLDFDPHADGEFALITEGRGRVHMRITFGATDAMRYLPVELMMVQGAKA